jgi:DNA (cytosine-5)-methyltransferase 1
MLLGHTCGCAVEIEPYCRKVLLQRQRDGILPKFPIWDDVRTFEGKPWRGLVDVVCGGFPCQDASPARTNNHINGKQRGIDGESTGLWQEMERIIGEVQPPFVFAENVPNIRNLGLGQILKDLAGLGYDCRWGRLGVRHFGADHHRARLWLLAYTNKAQRQGGQLSSRAQTKYEMFGCVDWWQNQPGMERVAHGMANQVDRLKAIGNGQVPAVARLAWEVLSA